MSPHRPAGRFLFVGTAGGFAVRVPDRSGQRRAERRRRLSVRAGRIPGDDRFPPDGGLRLRVIAALPAPAASGGVRCYAINRSSGAPTEVAGSPFATTLWGGAVVLHPSGKFLYDGGAFATGVHAHRRSRHGRPPPPSPARRFPGRTVTPPPSTWRSILGKYLYASDFGHRHRIPHRRQLGRADAGAGLALRHAAVAVLPRCGSGGPLRVRG